MMPALSSAAPRPYSRPSRSTAANGSEFQRLRSPGRLDVMVGVEQDSRFAFGGRAAGDDGRTAGRTVRLVAAQDPDVLHAGGPRPRTATASALRSSSPGIEARPGDPRNSHEVLQRRKVASKDSLTAAVSASTEWSRSALACSAGSPHVLKSWATLYRRGFSLRSRHSRNHGAARRSRARQPDT